ncbi:MAG TPA: maleylpyruvate isomerase family mycothiol-dependent enzyme [Acidimicrobiales bacterium]
MFHHLDPLTVRAAFPDAAEVFLATLAAVGPDQWDQPGLGEWTVRELAAHALRAFQTLQRHCDTRAEGPVVEAAPGYYRAVAQIADVHAGVAQRGHEAGAQLVDPFATARMTVEQALGRLAATSDEHVGETFAGPMRLADYLPTRVVELGIHTLDLQRATGQPLTLPASATGVILGTLAELSDVPLLLLAMTGRQALPDGFNVLA